MKNLVIERLRDAVRDAYPPGQTTVRTVDLEWLLDQHETLRKGVEQVIANVAARLEPPDRSAT